MTRYNVCGVVTPIPSVPDSMPSSHASLTGVHCRIAQIPVQVCPAARRKSVMNLRLLHLGSSNSQSGTTVVACGHGGCDLEETNLRTQDSCVCVCLCVCLLLQDLVQSCLHGGGGDMGGHVLREMTSRGLCGLGCPSRTSERGGEGDCVKGGGGEKGKCEREPALERLRYYSPGH
jgi:hypothetical protein